MSVFTVDPTLSPAASQPPPPLAAARSPRFAKRTASWPTVDMPIDFELPPALEAREPPEARGLARDQVRLLATSRAGRKVVHARFADLPDLLAPGDLLVANDSLTLPAALAIQQTSVGAQTLHLSTRQDDGLWVVEPRDGAPGKTEPRLAGTAAGEVIHLRGGGTATLLAPYAGSHRLWTAHLELPEPALAYLHRWGQPIAYSYVRGMWPMEMYQTVYGRVPGSAEMPSAGRAFTTAVLNRLRRRGIGFATVTLHTGVSSLEAHEPPYPERYKVSAAVASAIEAAKAAGGRVVAVGTTVVRALETAAGEPGRVRPSEGWTDLVVTPERGVRVVDGLLTGFHEPQATHLAMLEAISGREHLVRAYRAALDGGYLWHEFGDLHLLLP